MDAGAVVDHGLLGIQLLLLLLLLLLRLLLRRGAVAVVRLLLRVRLDGRGRGAQPGVIVALVVLIVGL